MLCRKPGKNSQMKTTVHNLLSVFTNSARMNWWGFLRLATDLLGGGGGGGQGIQTSPLPYLKFLPPQTFSLTSSLESRFSPCSLRNLEYCCVICCYFPYFPLFPTLLRTPTSRPFLSLLSYTSHPLSPRPPPPVLFDCLMIIAVYHFSFLLRLFSPKLVVDCFLFNIISIWDWSKWHLR